jgi:alpha-galactosidase
MAFKRTALLCFLSLGSTVVPLLAQGDVSGVWRVHSERPDGTFDDAYLNLKQEGKAVTGSVIHNYHGTPIKDGSFSGGKLHFTMNPWRQVVITYDGRLIEDALGLTVSTASEPSKPPKVIKASATRSNIEATRPPAPLPVPELHDVPDNGLVRTPPMGWNSWNHFAGKVTDATVRHTADVIAGSGMKEAGYLYVNIDDTWQGERDSAGVIKPNKKFPDMKALADYVHSKGLKIGIYSSPGPLTCAGYEGSMGHEAQDAKTYAEWGMDYLKYDWCSAGEIYKDSDLQAVYQKMGDALQASGRPIVYSLCQYGRGDVWKWGAKVGGNLWRTTGDIDDKWKSLEEIGFAQADINSYVKAGHWNDPDMLEVGNGGMTAEEYRVHMSLWALLSAPLLAGNDLEKMTPETKSILMNKDVIAVDQDPAAHHVKRTVLEGNTEVWTREMQDGSQVVALFNRGADTKSVTVDWSKVDIAAPQKARNLWTHKDVTLSGNSYSAMVPKHGVVMLRVLKS